MLLKRMKDFADKKKRNLVNLELQIREDEGLTFNPRINRNTNVRSRSKLSSRSNLSSNNNMKAASATKITKTIKNQ